MYLACDKWCLEFDNSKERSGLDNPVKVGAQGLENHEGIVHGS